MMNEQRNGISFSMKRRRVLIYRSSLRALGMPSNIRFLLNMKKKKVAVQVCEAIDRDSFKVPEIVDGGREQYEISSVSFLKMLYKLAGWKDDGAYKITGVLYPENRLVEFNLWDAVKNADEEFVDPEV